jgi:DNA-binding NtrC family response regulator
MNKPPIKILMAEDDQNDYLLVQGMLNQAEGEKFHLERAQNFETAISMIRQKAHDVYLLDYKLGEGNGIELLRAAVAAGVTAPVIVLTGVGNRDVDLEAMRLGASDYLVKGRFDAQLLERSIRYAREQKKSAEAIRTLNAELENRVAQRTAELQSMNEDLRNEIHERQRLQNERETLIRELQEALASVKTLSGLLPICASCKKVRDDKGYWNQVEVYFAKRADVTFTHGFCPDCLRKLRQEAGFLKES